MHYCYGSPENRIGRERHGLWTRSFTSALLSLKDRLPLACGGSWLRAQVKTGSLLCRAEIAQVGRFLALFHGHQIAVGAQVIHLPADGDELRGQGAIVLRPYVMEIVRV